jgi:hypothetical protein
VVDVSDPSSPRVVGSTTHWAGGITVWDGYAYLAIGSSGVQVVDVSDPTSPALVGGIDTPGSARNIAISEGYAFVTASRSLQVLSTQCRRSADFAPDPTWLTLHPEGSPSPGARDAAAELPGLTRLTGVQPNPWQHQTAIAFTLASSCQARLDIYDIQGRLVSTLLNEIRGAGPYGQTWNGRDHSGHRVAGGTYFVRLEAGGETMTRKVVFLGD